MARTHRVVGAATAGLLAAALSVGGVTPAEAVTVKAFKNCTAMHKVAAFKGGIAKPRARDRRAGGGHAAYKPYRSLKGYLLNKKSDRDHDGIACEQ